MHTQTETTKKRIEECALKECLEKGFNGASLRQIVKEAGVTTGAFYKYYSSKEALFEGLVKPCVNHVYEIWDTNYQQFIKQDLSEQAANMEENSKMLSEQFMDYIFVYRDIFRLVLTASEGTPYVDFLHNLALREEKSTFAFANLMKKQDMDVPELDR